MLAFRLLAIVLHKHTKQRVIIVKISELAAKQKRLMTWKSYIESEHCGAEIKQLAASKIDQFKKVLSECMNESQISPSNDKMIINLERELNLLFEDARETIYKL